MRFARVARPQLHATCHFIAMIAILTPRPRGDSTACLRAPPRLKCSRSFHSPGCPPLPRNLSTSSAETAGSYFSTLRLYLDHDRTDISLFFFYPEPGCLLYLGTVLCALCSVLSSSKPVKHANMLVPVVTFGEIFSALNSISEAESSKNEQDEPNLHRTLKG